MKLELINLLEQIPEGKRHRSLQLEDNRITYTPDTPNGLHILLITNNLQYTLVLNKWFQFTCSFQEAYAYLQWALSPLCRIKVFAKGEICSQSLQYFASETWHNKEYIKIIDFTVTTDKQNEYVLSNNLLTANDDELQKILPATTQKYAMT